MKLFVKTIKKSVEIKEQIKQEVKLQKQIETWYISKFAQKEHIETKYMLVKELEEDIWFLEENFEISEKVKNEAYRKANIKIKTIDKYKSLYRLTDDHGRIIP